MWAWLANVARTIGTKVAWQAAKDFLTAEGKSAVTTLLREAPTKGLRKAAGSQFIGTAARLSARGVQYVGRHLPNARSSTRAVDYFESIKLRLAQILRLDSPNDISFSRFLNERVVGQLDNANTFNTQARLFMESSAARFFVSTTQRFAVDYATAEAIQFINEKLAELETIKDLPPEEEERVRQFLNILSAALLYSLAGGLRGKRATHISQVTKSNAASFGERLSSSTKAARTYYGSRIPEVSGQLVGGTAAIIAANPSENPQELLAQFGPNIVFRGIGGFYGLTRKQATQQRLFSRFSVPKAKTVRKPSTVPNVGTNNIAGQTHFNL